MMISTERELRNLITKASQTPAVAIDTEFVWERTFYPNLGLVQLAIEQECFLIDPVAIKDISPLGELMANPSVTKILHDATQDLTILKMATGFFPVNIFDTRLAYGFCSENSTLSLAAMINEILDITLPKTETRANWLQRPLSDKMLEYACDDVKYLTKVMNLIVEKSQKQNTLSWLNDEMKIYDSPELYTETSPADYFRKIKGSGRMKSRQLAVLQELSTWREQTARKLNRPRGHVVHNNSMLDLTYKCPRQLSELKGINRLTPRAIKKFGENIIHCIEKGINKPVHLHPKPTPSMRKSPATDYIIDKIRNKAEAINIDPSLVCSKGELNSLINRHGYPANKDHRLFKGWRNEFMGELYQDNQTTAALNFKP